MTSKQEYHHNYYLNHYKDIIKGKKVYCECCSVEISAWNLYKHKQSKKHNFNSLSDNEKLTQLHEKENEKIKEKIKLLESKLKN